MGANGIFLGKGIFPEWSLAENNGEWGANNDDGGYLQFSLSQRKTLNTDAKRLLLNLEVPGNDFYSHRTVK